MHIPNILNERDRERSFKRSITPPNLQSGYFDEHHSNSYHSYHHYDDYHCSCSCYSYSYLDIVAAFSKLNVPLIKQFTYRGISSNITKRSNARQFSDCDYGMRGQSEKLKITVIEYGWWHWIWFICDVLVRKTKYTVWELTWLVAFFLLANHIWQYYSSYHLIIIKCVPRCGRLIGITYRLNCYLSNTMQKRMRNVETIEYFRQSNTSVCVPYAMHWFEW